MREIGTDFIRLRAGLIPGIRIDMSEGFFVYELWIVMQSVIVMWRFDK